MDFQLHSGVAPLLCKLFKGQLYLVSKIIASISSVYDIIKNISDLCPWFQIVSKALGISQVIGVSFVIHNEPLLTIPEFMLMKSPRVGP